MSNKLIFRKIKKDELKQLRTLLFKIFDFLDDKYYPHYLITKFKKENTIQYFEKTFKSKKSFFIGCFDERQLAGFIFGGYDKGSIFINWVCVNEEYRRKNIATELFKIVEKDAKNRNLKIFFNTCIKNIPAIRMYLKLGYEIEGAIKNFEGVKFIRFGKLFKHKKLTGNFYKMPDFQIEIKY